MFFIICSYVHIIKAEVCLKSSQTHWLQAHLAKMYLDTYYRARWKELNRYQSDTKDKEDNSNYREKRKEATPTNRNLLGNK